MSRVLLVFDDYSEMTLTEAQLKKIGFDVIGISNEYSVAGQLIAFNPEVVLVRGQKEHCLAVAKRVQDATKFLGKLVWVGAQSQRPVPDEMLKVRLDFFLEIPHTTERLIDVLAKMTGQDSSSLLDKYRRAQFVDGVDPNEGKAKRGGFLNEGPGYKMPDRQEDANRVIKYKSLIENMSVAPETTFEHSKVRQVWRDITKSWDNVENSKLEKLKRQFTALLFRKK